MMKAVIFDLDGTIVTFNLNVESCKTEVINYLINQDLPLSLFSKKDTIFESLAKAKKYITTEENNQLDFIKIQESIFSIIEKFELEAAKTTKIFSGISKTLQKLKQIGLKIGICTVNGKNSTDYILSHFNLKSFFDTVITREFVTDVKPNSAHLRYTLMTLDVNPNEAILIGDSTNDMVTANHLKVVALGVTTGISSKKELIQAGANYLATSANEIIDLIFRLNRNLLK